MAIDTALSGGHDLTGKVALVTGACGGLGQAISGRLAGAGATVIGADRVAPDTARAAFVECDIRDPQAWRQAIDHVMTTWGRLDMLIQAAGFYRPNIPFEELTLDLWRAHFQINLDGAFLGCQAAMPALRASGGGSILLFSSTLAAQPTPLSVAYSAAKAGIETLARAAARHGGPANIRVNAIAPGPIDTPMLRNNIREGQSAEDLFAMLAARVPMGRLGEAEDVAALVHFLVSDAARFINGAVLPLDGGQRA
jgi:NAD(P)-dependent dehydrogenase (short-subunit alcohol dehydrogenase family)